MSDDDDRELRQKSKDNERFEGDTINPDAAFHSAEANRRMSTGDGRSGSPGDDDVDLDGFGPDAAGRGVSKADLPDGAASDVGDLANQLLNLDDTDVAERYARIILRNGDRLSTIEDMVDEIEQDVVDIASAMGGTDTDSARLNDRLAD